MMAELERVICVECGEDFWREDDQAWRVRCVPCWLASKRSRPTKIDQSQAFHDLRAELGSNIKALLQLTHPDKHAGSRTATEVTQWLLSLRQRLGL